LVKKKLGCVRETWTGANLWGDGWRSVSPFSLSREDLKTPHSSGRGTGQQVKKATVAKS